MNRVGVGAFLLLVIVTATSQGQDTKVPAPQNSESAGSIIGTCSPEAEQVVRFLRVEYPVNAFFHKTEGPVDIDITMDSTGKVSDARPVGAGSRPLVNAALRAAKMWTVPLVDGAHQPASLIIRVDFKMLSEVQDQLDSVPFPEVKNAKNITATLERTGCYGVCPIYRLTIHGNGLVEYEGVSFVSSKGKHRTRITATEVNQLLDDFRKANYFGLQDKYEELRQPYQITVSSGGCSRIRREEEFLSGATDLPSTLTSLTVGVRTKKVLDYYGAPRELRTLEDQIDLLSHSKSWIASAKRKTLPR